MHDELYIYIWLKHVVGAFLLAFLCPCVARMTGCRQCSDKLFIIAQSLGKHWKKSRRSLPIDVRECSLELLIVVQTYVVPVYAKSMAVNIAEASIEVLPLVELCSGLACRTPTTAQVATLKKGSLALPPSPPPNLFPNDAVVIVCGSLENFGEQIWKYVPQTQICIDIDDSVFFELGECDVYNGESVPDIVEKLEMPVTDDGLPAVSADEALAAYECCDTNAATETIREDEQTLDIVVSDTLDRIPLRALSLTPSYLARLPTVCLTT